MMTFVPREFQADFWRDCCQPVLIAPRGDRRFTADFEPTASNLNRRAHLGPPASVFQVRDSGRGVPIGQTCVNFCPVIHRSFSQCPRPA